MNYRRIWEHLPPPPPLFPRLCKVFSTTLVSRRCLEVVGFVSCVQVASSMGLHGVGLGREGVSRSCIYPSSDGYFDGTIRLCSFAFGMRDEFVVGEYVQEMYQGMKWVCGRLFFHVSLQPCVALWLFFSEQMLVRFFPIPCSCARLELFGDVFTRRAEAQRLLFLGSDRFGCPSRRDVQYG